jgi:catechol 2,3-dioxygenase-like lactoylglutathione lyase family enzyme
MDGLDTESREDRKRPLDGVFKVAHGRGMITGEPFRFLSRKETVMKAILEKAWGYQGDCRNLPVRDLLAALPFYETVLGFRVLSRTSAPHSSAVLGRDLVQIGLEENGGDPTQDGCAFHVKGLEALFAEFKTNGLEKEVSDFAVEQHDEVAWKVFYVVAPDGLCYWFGERQGDEKLGQ